MDISDGVLWTFTVQWCWFIFFLLIYIIYINLHFVNIQCVFNLRTCQTLRCVKHKSSKPRFPGRRWDCQTYDKHTFGTWYRGAKESITQTEGFSTWSGASAGYKAASVSDMRVSHRGKLSYNISLLLVWKQTERRKVLLALSYQREVFWNTGHSWKNECDFLSIATNEMHYKTRKGLEWC